MKAMPLYKRVGYNWVPGTRVLMESHIPGILGAEMFREFFERYDWYDSFKVKITQDIDDIVEEGFGVFRYHFEGNNDDVLNVKVDREAKGICGFSMTLDGKTISAKCVNSDALVVRCTRKGILLNALSHLSGWGHEKVKLFI